MMKTKTIIWADDDQELMNKSEPLFQNHGFNIIKCNSIAEALKQVMLFSSDKILLDIDFPGNSKEGIIFLEQIKRLNPAIKAILFTGYPEINDAVKSVRDLLASDYLAKPIPFSVEKRKEFFERLHHSFENDLNKLSNENKVSVEGSKINKLKDALENCDINLFVTVLQSVFACLSYNMKVQESYYHAFIQIILDLIGVKIDSEIETNIGRIDAVVETKKFLYIIEFKLNDVTIAIDQIKRKKYVQKYLPSQKQIMILGVSFDNSEKNIKDFVLEKYIQDEKVD